MPDPVQDAPDPHNLQRFVDAQARIYDQALLEILGGRKTSHWMWFVFPQIQGLGHSPTARFYAISSQEEARAYLANPVLGPRLRECVEALLALPGNDPRAIFGSPDDLKLRSSMTLFMAASSEPLFGKVLAKFFGGRPDSKSLARLQSV